MTTEQPYFVVQVDRCGKCPHERSIPSWNFAFVCRFANDADGFEVHAANRNGIGPTCPMWPQRVEPPKD